MLMEFSVGNYRSFKDVVTLSMLAAPIDSSVEGLDKNNKFAPLKDIELLKSAVIYGANASGKSNLLKALGFMADFVTTSAMKICIYGMSKRLIGNIMKKIKRSI
jgi:uncharacterized protein